MPAQINFPMSVGRDVSLGLPASISIEKGIMFIAVIEELRAIAVAKYA